jgi:hypothetical protein
VSYKTEIVRQEVAFYGVMIMVDVAKLEFSCITVTEAWHLDAHERP